MAGTCSCTADSSQTWTYQSAPAVSGGWSLEKSPLEVLSWGLSGDCLSEGSSGVEDPIIPTGGLWGMDPWASPSPCWEGLHQGVKTQRPGSPEAVFCWDPTARVPSVPRCVIPRVSSGGELPWPCLQDPESGSPSEGDEMKPVLSFCSYVARVTSCMHLSGAWPL